MNGSNFSFESLMGMGVPGVSMGMIEGLVSPSVVPTDIKPEEFQSLLDIVSDLEIADTQNAGFSESFESEVLAQMDSGQRDLMGAKNESAIVNQMQGWVALQKESVIPHQEIVGQSAPLVELAETINPKEMVLGSTLELGAIENLQRQSSKQVSAAQKGEAVQAWALAIAAGDVKAVDVVAEKQFEEAKVFAPTEVFVPLKGTLQSPQENQAGLKSEALPQLTQTNVKAPRVDKEVELTKAAIPSSAPEMSLAKNLNLGSDKGFERIVPPVVVGAEIKNSESNQKPKAKMNPQFESANFKLTDSEISASSSKSEIESPVRPLEKSEAASEFLLKEQTKGPKKIQVASGAEDTQAFLPAAALSVVRDAESLGEPGDKRLNPQTMGLVAEKIENLKAQGGGTLRVELAPKDLGAIEIRVTQRPSGLVMVKLSAEKISTRDALGASQSDLALRIEQSGTSARVEISSIVGGINQVNASQLGVQSASTMPMPELASASLEVGRSAVSQAGQGRDLLAFGMSTHDFKGLMEGGSKMDFRNSNGFEQSRNPDLSGQNKGFEGRGANQQGSREKAFDQWSSLFEQKKSA